MSNFVMITDSCCDLPASLAEKMQIEVLPLTVYVDDDSYHNYLDGREIGFHDFYVKLVSAKNVKTAAVNHTEFIAAMEPHLAAGKDVLALIFSSGLSGTFNASAIAVNELREKYPDRKIYTVDTLSASMGQGLFVYQCWKQQQAGKTIDEVYAYAEALVPNIAQWFTVNDLFFLKRGGRVSAATAIVGSALAIKPVMHVDEEGHLTKVSVARGRKGSIRALVEKMSEIGVDLANQPVFISHGDCEDEANYLASLIREKFGTKEIVISYVGPVIGAHAGPGVLALFYPSTGR